MPRSPEDRDPWRPLDGFTLAVYPWVEGVVAMERGPTALAARVAVGSFVPWGAEPVRALDARIGQVRDGEPLRRELAGFWRDHRDEIAAAADRAERLGRVVAATRPS